MKKRVLLFLGDAALSAAILGAATLAGFLFRRWDLHESNVVVVYLFSVLLVSRFTHRFFYGIAASAASLLLFNWFFTAPYHTLKVNDMNSLVTFFILIITSVVTGTLTAKVKQAAADAREREHESNALYRMTNLLTDAEDAEAIARVIVSTVGTVLTCPVGCLCFDEKGAPESAFVQRREDGSIIRRALADGDELRRRMERLHEGADVTQQEFLFPVYGRSAVLAVVRIPREVGRAMEEGQTRMLHSIIESAALALERLRSLQAQAHSREETAQERYRGDLLRSISHDIRTPLAGIMGSGEMLLDATPPGDPRRALAEDICRDAQWLHGMVENILNLTKLQDGKLRLNKQPEALEEVIGAALTVMEKRLPGRAIDVEMPDGVIMVPMDAKLISQVLINLLDNAGKYTPPATCIAIVVSATPGAVEITVADRGPGIPEGDLPHIFRMFYTTAGKNTDARRGVGLGLAICRSIAQAHGGTIRAENREGGGAAFTLTLPAGGDAS